MILRLSREFCFEMAHALENYDGPCRNIHGHSYRLWVTVKGRVINTPGSAEGMVMDFKQLKNLVNQALCSHSTMLWCYAEQWTKRKKPCWTNGQAS